jgi:hypothetical protein
LYFIVDDIISSFTAYYKVLNLQQGIPNRNVDDVVSLNSVESNGLSLYGLGDHSTIANRTKYG